MKQEIYEKFKKNLLDSNDAVIFAGKWFESKGFNIEIPEIKISPTHEERMKYMDKGDLFISKNGQRKRIEVKRSGYNFLTKEDWLFNTFIVCAKHSYDMAEEKPYLYMILSHDLKAVAVVLSNTSSRWYTKYIHDKRYGAEYYQWFYLCDFDDVTWYKFKEGEI